MHAGNLPTVAFSVHGHRKRGDSPAVALATRDSYSPNVALTARRLFAHHCICCGASNSAKDPGLPLA